MNKTYPYVPAIDGLRAVAVIAVLIFHLDAVFLPGGFAGVDVFFVISGYVVARSLVGRRDESFGAFLTGFYSRRIRRIVPALILCLLVTALFTVLFVPDSWLSSTTRQVGLFAFFGLSNLALVWFQDDYFSPRAEFNPFVHTWSLGVEEQFYFIFPLLMFFWFRYCGQPGSPLALFGRLLFPVLALASFVAAFYLGPHRPDWAYYMLPARFWELAAGVMLFQLQATRKIPMVTRTGANVMLAAGALMIAAGYVWADPAAFPYPWALLPVLGSVLVIWSVSANGPHAPWLARGLTLRPILYIGRTSYSLYLWHWPVFTLMRWTVGLDTPLLMASGLAATGALAFASYHWVETPVRQARPLAKPAWRAVVAGLAAMVAFWVAATQLFDERATITLSITGDTATWYPYAYSAGLPVEPDGIFQGRQLFVVGNSHTGAYATMVSLLEQQTGISTHLHQMGHCAVGNLLYPIGEMPGCTESAEGYFDFLSKTAKPGDVVFLASLRTHRLSDQWFREDPQEVLARSQDEQTLSAIERAHEETGTFLLRMHELGLRVLIDAPKPVLKAPLYRCSDWFNRNNPVCVGEPGVRRDFMESLREPVLVSIERLTASHPQVFLWDPLPALCTEDVCPAYSDTGEPLFFDGDHLSAHGNRVLYPSFEQALVEIYAPSK